MFGPHDQPFGRVVGVAGEDLRFKGGELGRSALETEAKFFGPRGTALPREVRHDGAVNLDADGQTAGDGIRCQAFSLGVGGDSGPGDQHSGGFLRATGGRKRGF